MSSKFMLVNPGLEFLSLDWKDWKFAFFWALKAGWEPMGTKSCVRLGRQRRRPIEESGIAQTWLGSVPDDGPDAIEEYLVSAPRRVDTEDAAGMADALERVIAKFSVVRPQALLELVAFLRRGEFGIFHY